MRARALRASHDGTEIMRIFQIIQNQNQRLLAARLRQRKNILKFTVSVWADIGCHALMRLPRCNSVHCRLLDLHSRNALFLRHSQYFYHRAFGTAYDEFINLSAAFQGLCDRISAHDKVLVSFCGKILSLRSRSVRYAFFRRSRILRSVTVAVCAALCHVVFSLILYLRHYFLLYSTN